MDEELQNHHAYIVMKAFIQCGETKQFYFSPAVNYLICHHLEFQLSIYSSFNLYL